MARQRWSRGQGGLEGLGLNKGGGRGGGLSNIGDLPCYEVAGRIKLQEGQDFVCLLDHDAFDSGEPQGA